MNIIVRRQKRTNLAFRLAADRAEVLIPRTLTADHPAVRAFIAHSLADLPPLPPPAGHLEPADMHVLVERWSERLNVTVRRLQIRPMTRKWGSLSSTGVLTLSSDLCQLPLDLVEYVVVHELLHLRFPDHHRGWKISMGMVLPAWRELERRLQQYAPCSFASPPP